MAQPVPPEVHRLPFPEDECVRAEAEDAGQVKAPDAGSDAGFTPQPCAAELLVVLFSAQTFCDRVDACELSYNVCREATWTSTEVRDAVGVLDRAERHRCLESASASDDCYLSLDCREFSCYFAPDGCPASGVPQPVEECHAAYREYLEACGELDELLVSNRNASLRVQAE